MMGTYKNYAEGLRERIWNSKIVKALRSAFNQGGSSERLLVLELYRKGIIYGMSYFVDQD